MELILVVIFSISFHNYKPEGLIQVGEIPKTLPLPNAPKMTQVSISDCVTIAIISFVMVISLGKQFAQLKNYKISPNCEAVAIGIANIGSSLFNGMPVSGSLGRSSLQFSVGGRSKIASLVSCGVLIILTLVAGPVLAVLPKHLACIIIVNLRRLLCQITETDKIGKISRVDLFLWVGNFFSVIFCGIIIGFIIGFCLLLITLAYSSLLGTSEISKTDSGIVSVSGPLNFVTIEKLVDLLHDNKVIDIIDLSKTGHIDYIAMQTLKDLLANDEQASEDADNDQSHATDDQSVDNDDRPHNNDDQSHDIDNIMEEPAIKVILPINCPDAFQEFLADANILFVDVDHHIE